MKIKIKICGMTDTRNALEVLECGPDFLGFIMYPESPRYVTPQKAKEIILQTGHAAGSVGVFVNEPFLNVLALVKECGFDYVQLHGDESFEDVESLIAEGVNVIKAFRVKDASILEEIKRCPSEYFLFDAFHKDLYGGTGESIKRDLLNDLKKDAFLKDKKVFLSGGLHAGNVLQNLSVFTPYAVDSSSCLELNPGIKDIPKVKDFIKKIKSFSPLA